MKSIVFAAYNAGRGGASKVMSLVQNYYASKGWNVTYVVRDIFQAYELDKRIKIIQIGKNPDFSKRFYIKWLRNYVKTNNVDAVVSFLLMPNVISLSACRGLKVRNIISERNDPRNYSKVYKLLAKVFYRMTDKIVFQTDRAKMWYPKAVQRKGVIIRNPVRTECEALPFKQRNKKFVSAGRLEPQKNQKMLIEAFAEFVKIHTDYKLYIYGEGDLRSELEALIESLSLKDSVFLPGNVLNIHEQFSDARGFILPSNFEGLSNALLEAMMMGLTCISTDCAGSDEVIRNNENGILIHTGDKDALTVAMNKTAADDSFAENLAKNAKKDSEEFKENKILSFWEKAIEGE